MSELVNDLHWKADYWPAWMPDAWWHKLLCRLFGHLPMPDQCGNPTHDYCGWCQKSMPGRGVNPATGLRYGEVVE